MEKFSQGFQGQDMEKAMKMAQSDTAKALLALLQSNNSSQLQSAMNQASTGNLSQAKDILQQMLASDQARQLLQKLREENNG